METKQFNTWGILFGIAGVVVVLSGIVSGGIWITRPVSTHAGGLEALLTIIPAASATSAPSATPFVTSSPDSSAVPTPPSANIAIGEYVQIVGTGGEGLRLRDEPGLGNTILTLASDAEVFDVLDGPRDADGYVWWYIADPYNETRRGWAATNYLLTSQKP